MLAHTREEQVSIEKTCNTRLNPCCPPASDKVYYELNKRKESEEKRVLTGKSILLGSEVFGDSVASDTDDSFSIFPIELRLGSL